MKKKTFPKVKPYVAKDRLNALADFLDTVPKERFNFDIFADGKLNECGTAGCALGWATTMTRFKRMGLQLTLDKNRNRLEDIEVGEDKAVYMKVVLKKNNKKVAEDFETAERIFGITEAESEALFMPYSGGDWSNVVLLGDAHASAVAANIRKFIKWKWPANGKTQYMHGDEPCSK